MDGKNIVTKISVFGLESRKTPVSHHVYVMRETWSDTSENLICRRYDEFVKFQEQLKREFRDTAPTFPVEALPDTTSPDQISLDEVVKRVEAVEKFIKQVITSPEVISSSSVVAQFLAPDERDIKTWGKMKEKYRKHKAKPPQVEGKFEIEVGGLYTATRSYNAITQSEHSFEAGTVFLVVAKHKEGWWKASYNNNEAFVHESFLKKMEDAVIEGVPSAHPQASAEICDCIFPPDKCSTDSSQESMKEMTTPSKIELKLHKTGDFSTRKAEINSPDPENATVRESHGIDEHSRSKHVDSIGESTLPMNNKALKQNGWVPQRLDEMNPKYKEKFMKISSAAKKKEKGASENGWRPKESDQLNSKFKENNIKKNGVSQDGKKSNNPLQRIFKKKISRSHRERSKSMGNLLTTGNEFQTINENKEELELNNNETDEIQWPADTTAIDEESACKRSQSVSTVSAPAVWSDAGLETPPLKEKKEKIERNINNDSKREKDQISGNINPSNKVGLNGNLQDDGTETSTDKMMKLTSGAVTSVNMTSSNELVKQSTEQANIREPDSDTAASSGRTSQQYETEGETFIEDNIPKVLLSSTNKSSSNKSESLIVCAKFSYRAGERGEVSFDQGEEMEVIRKSRNGWWLVVIGDRKGWAPSNFLMPTSYFGRRKNGVCSPVTKKLTPRSESPDSELARIIHQKKPRSTGSSPSTSFTNARVSPRNFYSSASIPRYFTFESYATCSSCDGVPRAWSPASPEPARSPLLSQQLPSPTIDDMNISSSAVGSYICDAECIASHANDGQEILNVANKEVVEVLYQDKRGYSLVRVPSKYGWVPTTCIRQEDTT